MSACLTQKYIKVGSYRGSECISMLTRLSPQHWKLLTSSVSSVTELPVPSMQRVDGRKKYNKCNLDFKADQLLG